MVNLRVGDPRLNTRSCLGRPAAGYWLDTYLSGTNDSSCFLEPGGKVREGVYRFAVATALFPKVSSRGDNKEPDLDRISRILEKADQTT